MKIYYWLIMNVSMQFGASIGFWVAWLYYMQTTTQEATSQAPRNWMDEQKEHMNERAFSSSLANDPPQEGTNAYALNTAIDEEDMFHKPMPGLRPPGAIPVPPPIPDHLKLNIGGGKATDLY